MGVIFHAAVVFGLGKEFLFKSTLGHCDGKSQDHLSFSSSHRICVHSTNHNAQLGCTERKESLFSGTPE